MSAVDELIKLGIIEVLGNIVNKLRNCQIKYSSNDKTLVIMQNGKEIARIPYDGDKLLVHEEPMGGDELVKRIAQIAPKTNNENEIEIVLGLTVLLNTMCS